MNLFPLMKTCAFKDMLYNNLAKNLKLQKLLIFKQHQFPCPSFSESSSSKTPAIGEPTSQKETTKFHFNSVVNMEILPQYQGFSTPSANRDPSAKN
jgi:hypothetical protein